MSKTVQNWEFPYFELKTIENFGNSHVFTLATKKVLNFLGIPNEKCGYFFFFGGGRFPCLLNVVCI